MRVGNCLGGGLVSFSSGIMAGLRSAVPTLGGGARVVHGTILVGATGRGSLVRIVGVMASRKIAVIFYRVSSLLLYNFSKGSDGWGVCRAMENSLEIMVALLVDNLKCVWGEWGKFYFIGDALTACLWYIYPVVPVMFK